MCIVNPFDRVMVGDEAVHNDLECPLLILTQKLESGLYSYILSACHMPDQYWSLFMSSSV